jgi:hypothetical protein
VVVENDSAKLKSCPYRKSEGVPLTCSIASNSQEPVNATSVQVCQQCTIPEIIDGTNCVNLKLSKQHLASKFTDYDGVKKNQIFDIGWNARCEKGFFDSREDYETKCSPSSCPEYKPIHKDVSEIVLPNLTLESGNGTDREIRQLVLRMLYDYHRLFPERYGFFDITMDFLSSNSMLEQSDVLRVIGPMENEGEVEKSEDGKYFRITNTGIRMIDKEPLFERSNTTGTHVTGDQINISGGQIGAVGFNANAQNNTFQQVNNFSHSVDADQLLSELTLLLEKLREYEDDPDKEEDVSAIKLARNAAERKDVPKALARLSRVDKWVSGIASQVGAGLIVEYLKNSFGI